ncbi:deoxyribonuclease-2-beta isoform X2 [Dicentrarchus labrax]|uniref:deoxyribonuclease-2-beta isoform X2 n=1 Tax=Dicentrarchus labrax TaxID=13489 RepID=UPI0021F62447|nr:deoxyribonuclease-2-beta isoform X2 [Dicentrarchus labrax]
MATRFSLCLHIIITSLCSTVYSSDISCRNEDGEPVDWFIIYKLPKYKIGEVGSGVDYMYLDSSAGSWQMSKFMVNTSQGAIGSTLNQLYTGKAYKSNSSVYGLYNDAPPILDYIQGYGHTKGLLLFDRSQGFWLSHTIPHFPSFPERGYLYPSSGKVNGQTALCVTYQYEQFLRIAKQMAYIYPRFYNCSVPAAFLVDLPQLAQLCEGTKPTLASDKRVEQLFSTQGDKFVSFVKSEHFVDGADTLSSQDSEAYEHTPYPRPSEVLPAPKLMQCLLVTLVTFYGLSVDSCRAVIFPILIVSFVEKMGHFYN